METKYLQAIVIIAREGNLTKAAKKLYVTPSALTQMLKHVEGQIGQKLFLRSQQGCRVTKAGSTYLHWAKIILEGERNLQKAMEDFSGNYNNTLTIGFPPERCSTLFCKAYPAFHKQYPQLTIRIREARVLDLLVQLERGDLDLAFVTMQTGSFPPGKIHFIPLYQEEMLVAVPKDQGPYTSPVQLNQLQHQAFALMGEDSTMGLWQKELFRQAGFSPNVIFTTGRNKTILNMVNLGFCSTLLPDFYEDESYPNVAFLPMEGHPQWIFAAVTRQGTYLSTPQKDFIELVKQT